MSRKVFLKYPCGKLFELRIPISINMDNKVISVLPGEDSYFINAKKKFEINNIVVVEKEISDKTLSQSISFISLTKKIRCVE